MGVGAEQKGLGDGAKYQPSARSMLGCLAPAVMHVTATLTQTGLVIFSPLPFQPLFSCSSICCVQLETLILRLLLQGKWRSRGFPALTKVGSGDERVRG